MPASEIDDIFASKGKTKAISPAEVAPSLPEKKKKKKKDKKLSAPAEQIKPSSSKPAPSEPKSSKKRAAPETVVDPSVQSVPQKRIKSDAPSNISKTSSKDKSKEDEERFRDSRGSGPRRKTDDGYNIYKEDELGITSGGGDTPLCPFDCECCF
ncbi:hypothetical protein HYDPIDRAFT_106468 [Hydnomerulius pinastri MD-312]|nr:hypothetical protein HYDPIDRAFT_106468 [Hydnomerulius pinastri MD-312]